MNLVTDHDNTNPGDAGRYKTQKACVAAFASEMERRMNKH